MTGLLRDDADYQALRKKLIISVEGNKPDVYTDSAGLATIGYGFNIKDNDTLRKAVYVKLDIGTDVVDAAWRAKLDDVINKFSTPNDKTVLLAKLNAILLLRKNAMLDSDPKKESAALSFSINATQAAAIFDEGVKPFEDKLDVWLGNATIDAGQRAALLSLTWAGLVGYTYTGDKKTLQKNYTYASPQLRAAVLNGNRVEAWYQIRYQSNADVGGIQSWRRYMESQLFGLFADPKNVSDADAKSAVDMYLDPAHQAIIKKYEALYQNNILSNSDDKLQAAGIKGADGTALKVDDIGQIFKPIANYIYKTYTATADAAANKTNVGVTDFNAAITGDVVLGFETAVSGEAKAIQPIYRTLYNTSPTSNIGLPAGVTGINDMLVALDDKAYTLQGLWGDDVLIGGKNNDTLYGGYQDVANHPGNNDGDDALIGGDGNDNLYGGTGNNVLRGGNGMDNYYIDRGPNTITHIDDLDHQGKIFIKNPGETNYTELGNGKGTSLTYMTSVNVNGTGYLGYWWETDANGKAITSKMYALYKDTTSGKYYLYFYPPNSNTSDLAIKDFASGDFGITVDHFDKAREDVIALPDSRAERTTPPVVAPSNQPNANRVSDPLAFDMNGDGVVGTKSLLQGVHVDLDNNGFAEQTSWVSANDGLLVLDRNHNNSIDGGAELFGSETTLQNGQKAADGFAALADVDANHDGKIDASDAIYNQLRIWKDANSNGIADSGELITLSAANIASINLQFTTAPVTDVQGVVHQQQGSYTKTDNSTGIINTLLFNTDTRLTVPVQTLNGNPVTIPSDIALLPNAVGFGNNYSLREAMALDASGNLKNTVLAFTQETDPLKRKALVNTMLIAWTHQDAVAINARGAEVNAQHIGVLESVWGAAAAPKNLTGSGAVALEKIYQQLTQSVYAQLMQQTQYANLFAQITFTNVGGDWHGDFTKASAILVNNIVQGSANAVATLQDFSDVVHGMQPYDLNPLYQDFAAAITTAVAPLSATLKNTVLGIVLAGDDALVGTAAADVINGYDGNDTLEGLAGDDVLIGGAGNDQLSGSDGNDTLSGGAGINFLSGGVGDDTYVLNLGDGTALINETAGNDTLQLGAGIAETDVTLRHDGANVTLTLSTGETAIIENMFSGGSIVTDGVNDNAIEKIQFNNGVVWDLTRMQQAATQGTSGADNIIGFAGNDVIAGGRGDDALAGLAGDDTYTFSAGDGNDTITDSGGNDAITFTADISNQQTIIQRIGTDLVINTDASNSITVKNMFDAATGLVNADNAIETINFSGGSVDLNAIAAQVLTLPGTANSDVLVGSDLSETLRGGQGDDQLIGGNGDDTYQYNLGDGNDVITDTSGNDTLRLTGGIDPSQVYVKRDANNNLVFTMATPAGGSITVNNAFGTQINSFTQNTIESVVFDNGVTWDLTRILNESFKQVGTAGNDTLTGTDVNDTLIGGKGNDLLVGKNGDDIYQYNLGDGSDTIVDGAGNNILSLGAGLNTSNVKVDRDATNNVNIIMPDDAIVTVSNAVNAAGQFTANMLQYVGFSNGVFWSQQDIAAQLAQNTTVATSSSDQLFGTNGSDVLNGLDGNDTIRGVGGNDTFIGGTGSDQLYGGVGDDTYVLNPNDGDDTIYEKGGNNTIYLGAGIAEADVHVARRYRTDFVLTTTDHTSATLYSMFDSKTAVANANNAIQHIQFANGVVWDYNRIKQEILRYTNGSDDIEGLDQPNTINGGGGDDTLVGASFNDTLTGGIGNDYVVGGAGDDLYLYNLGDGNDTINDASGNDTLRFGAGISSQTVGVSKVVNGYNPEQSNIVLTLPNQGQITLTGAFNNLTSQLNDTYKIETIQFSNGDTWGASDILDKIIHPQPIPILGDDGDNMLTGTGGDDVIIGGKGNDQFTTTAGVDTYMINPGDGFDTITRGAMASNTSTVKFGAGINESDVRVLHQSNALLMNIGTAQSVTINSMFNDDGSVSGLAPINAVAFASGASWDINRIKTEILKSTDQNDDIQAFETNDTLSGGKGSDHLDGKSGNDTYLYNLGDGNDTIYDLSGTDQVVFGAGITPATISLTQQAATNLLITISDGSQLNIDSMFLNKSDTNAVGIESIRFADNTVWDIAKIRAESLKGTRGADSLEGFASDDTLIGGGGYDIVKGGLGNDTYVFNHGDGVDDITDVGGNDTLKFGPNINPSDVIVYHSGAKLYFLMKNGDKLTVNGQLTNGVINSQYEIDNVIFDNSTVWNATTLATKAAESRANPNLLLGTGSWETLSTTSTSDVYINALDGIDLLVGGDGNDTLVGGGGKVGYGVGVHELVGGGGINTYLITSEPGENYIIPSAPSVDHVQFAEGILPSDVTLSMDPSNRFSYIDSGSVYVTQNTSHMNVVMTVGASKTYLNYKLTGNNLDIADVKFADGTVWNGATLLQQYRNGTNGNDFIAGDQTNNTLTAKIGNDTLEGYSGNDVLISGAGNDTLVGDDGDDLYKYARGNGSDIISDSSGIDRLSFDTGIARTDLSFQRKSDDLIVAIKNSSDTITIRDWFNYKTVEYIDVVGDASLTFKDVANAITSSVQKPSAVLNSNGVVAGVAALGATVTVTYFDAYRNGYVHLADVTADASTGAYSYQINSTYLDGRDIFISASDQSGNGSAVVFLTSADLTPPSQPTAAFDTTGKIITGVAEISSTVVVKNSAGTQLGTATADATTGAYTLTLATALINKESVNVTAKDAAGNMSTAKTITAPDLTAPNVPTAAFDTTGKIITGVAEISSTVIVKNSAGTQLGTATADATTGAYTLTLATALINKESVNVTAKDAAGNMSTVKTISAPDLTAPNVPTAAFDTTGKIITGVAEISSTVVVKNSAGTQLGTATADATTGAYTLTLTTALINKETVNVTAKDAAGNMSTAKTISAPDLTAPNVPTAAFDTTGKIITGVAEISSTVIVKNSAGTQLGTATANATTGAYSITIATALINKQIVNVTAKDAAGNISTALSVTAPDLTAPTVPTAAFDTTGKIITGVAEISSTVVVKNSAGTQLGTATADATTGAYTLTLATALINKETVNVTAKDAAGNVSTAKAIIAPDLTAPNVPTAVFDAAGKVVSGTAEPGSSVMVKNAAGSQLGTMKADATTGAYSITIATALINKQIVNVTTKDAAGNISAAVSITAPDLTAPTVPTAAFDATGKIITGTAEISSTVIVKNTAGTQLGTATANATTGAYSITLATALINKETVNVTAKDAAGNTSAAKAIVAPDKTPPAAPTGAFNTAGKIISGTAEISSTVVVKNAAGTQIGTATANATTGAYSITLATALTNQETVSITAKDAAGNVSAATPLKAPLAVMLAKSATTLSAASVAQTDALIQAMAAFAPPAAAETKTLVGASDAFTPMLVSHS